MPFVAVEQHLLRQRSDAVFVDRLNYCRRCVMDGLMVAPKLPNNFACISTTWFMCVGVRLCLCVVCVYVLLSARRECFFFCFFILFLKFMRSLLILTVTGR